MMESVSLSEALGKAIARPVDTACKLVETLLGEPFRVAGGALSDHVAFWQWKNRLKMLDRVDQLLEERGAAPREMAPEFLLPLIREAGDAEDPDLQELWAQLLAGAIESDAREHRGFIDVIRGMSAQDARVFAAMLDLGAMKMAERIPAIAKHLELPSEKVRLSMLNLARLGFLNVTHEKLTGFAAEFARVCMGGPAGLDKYLEDQKGFGGALLVS